MAATPSPAPTRQRLVEAGMRLFAARGFQATSVGEIEAAAGLQPRRGALYKHFASKQALLETAVRAYIDRAAEGAVRIGELTLPDASGTGREQLQTVLMDLGRWFLAEMDHLEDLTRVLERDGPRIADLVGQVKTDIVDLSYKVAAALIAGLTPDAPDPDATAVLLLGALVALRRTAWTFGSPPLDVDDVRILTAWVDLTLVTLHPGPTDDP